MGGLQWAAKQQPPLGLCIKSGLDDWLQLHILHVIAIETAQHNQRNFVLSQLTQSRSRTVDI